MYLRFESREPGRRGTHAGVFALANGLARTGRLSSVDHAWWRAGNAWYEAELPNPGRVDPSLFDRERNPVVSCWFRATAGEALERVDGYLGLLSRYATPWRLRRSPDPGRVLYEDEFQVMVAPDRHSYRPLA